MKCEGEAHSNLYVDNCMICAPRWGKYPTCPDCTGRIREGRRSKTGTCMNEDCLSFGKKFGIPHF
jgi:hypothetical protein